MTKFIYKAKQGPKKVVEGTLDADNLEQAIKKLLQMGHTPLDVRKAQDRRRAAGFSLSRIFSQVTRHIPSDEITSFTRQISDLLGAGVPILRSLNVVSRQIRFPRFREMIEEIMLAVKDGEAFSSALARYPVVFPPLYSNMIKSGELSGSLAEVMARLADLWEKDEEVRSQVKTSLLYPALIMVVGAATVFILLTWVIPRITAIFEDMDQSIPFLTAVLLAISRFCARFWWFIIGSCILVFFYLKHFYETPQGRERMDRFVLDLPMLGDFVRDVQVGRFARILGTLLGSGVNIVAALDSVSWVLDNAVLRREVQEMKQKVIDGSALASALEGQTLFPEDIVHMVAVGEESGRVAESLNKLASFYESRTQRVVKRLTSLIEPVLILVLGSIVAFIVMAMLLPIFRMNLTIQ